MTYFNSTFFLLYFPILKTGTWAIWVYSGSNHRAPKRLWSLPIFSNGRRFPFSFRRFCIPKYFTVSTPRTSKTNGRNVLPSPCSIPYLPNSNSSSSNLPRSAYNPTPDSLVHPAHKSAISPAPITENIAQLMCKRREVVPGIECAVAGHSQQPTELSSVLKTNQVEMIYIFDSFLIVKNYLPY